MAAEWRMLNPVLGLLRIVASSSTTFSGLIAPYNSGGLMLIRAFVVAFIAFPCIFVAPGFSQAIMQYGTTVSGSSTAVTATGPAIAKSINLATNAIGNKTSQSQPKGASIAKPSTTVPTLEATMQSNKQKLESAAGANGATVQIASVPAQTIIYIDGLAVAYAPTEVRLPVGKHVFELQRPAYLGWRTQLSLASGETIRLEPKLAADPRQLVVSFK